VFALSCAHVLIAADSPALITKLDCPDRVSSVAFSPDGKLLAAGFGWNEAAGIRVWSVGDRRLVYSWDAPKVVGGRQNVHSIVFSPDGKFFVAANWGGSALLWNVGAWGRPVVIISNAGSPTGLAFSPDSTFLLFTSKVGATIYNFRSADSKNLALPKALGRSFFGGGYSTDGTTIFICDDSEIELWDANSNKVLKTWTSQAYGFFCTLSPQRNYIVPGGFTSSDKDALEVHSAVDGTPLGQIVDFRTRLYASAISHSEMLIALAGGSYGGRGDLGLWDVRKSKELGYVSFGEMPIQSVAFSSDDSLLAAGSDDGFVLLYSVDLLRGAQIAKQSTPLCGEVVFEGTHAFITPIAKVPPGFEYAWKHEIAEPEKLKGLDGYPIALLDWSIESNSSSDRLQVHEFRKLLYGSDLGSAVKNFVIFGDIQNPGWNKGFLAKIYGDGSFVAANNPGTCVAYGSLGESTSIRDFAGLKASLLKDGLLSLAKLPLTRQYPHFRTRFIELSDVGKSELRTDAEVVDMSHPVDHPTKKEADFQRLYDKYESFLDALRQVGAEAPH